jgi:uncharacterized BrkB/YihY/UPF0761 family membrane protein
MARPGTVATVGSRPVPRAGGRAARVRARAEGAQRRLVETRATVPAVEVAFAATRSDTSVGGSLLACAVAYRLFLWLLPTSLLLTAGLGFLSAAERDGPEQLAEGAGLSAYVVSSVGDASAQATSGRWFLLAVGLIGLYSAGTGGAKAVRAVQARAWGVPPGRPHNRLVASVAFSAVTLAAALATTAGAWVDHESAGLGVALRAALVAVYGLLWLVASMALPHASDARWRDLVPGALLLAAGAQAIHLVTVFYLADRIEKASELYGALGAASAVLLWLYLIGRLVVGSAVLNATLWDRRHPGGTTTRRG